jgi:hypothetical protein
MVGRYRAPRQRRIRSGQRRPTIQYAREFPGFSRTNTRQNFLLPRTSLSGRADRSRHATRAETVCAPTIARRTGLDGLRMSPVYSRPPLSTTAVHRHGIACLTLCHVNGISGRFRMAILTWWRCPTPNRAPADACSSYRRMTVPSALRPRYEERVTLWHARTFDEAIANAEVEADSY